MANPEKIVVHQLKKDSGEKSAELVLSDNLTNIGDNAVKLVNALHESYRKDRELTYGIFDFENQEIFPTEFHRYINSNKSTEDFLDFSKESVKHLRSQIQNVTFAKGGYLAFCEYEVNSTYFIGTFLIRDTEGIIFNYDQEKYEVDTIKYMNTNNLAMGCSINQRVYNEDSGNYLTFITRPQLEISEYFLNWIAIGQRSSNKEFTNQLYEMLSTIPRPIDSETEEEYDLNKFRQDIATAIKSNKNKVDLHQLGETFYGDSERLINHKEQNNYQIDTNFKVNSNALRKFKQISLKGGGFEIKFSRGVLNTSKITTGEDNKVIITSKELYNKLIAEQQDG